MADAKCVQCKEIVDAKAKVCPHCGKQWPSLTVAHKVSAVFVALFALGLMVRACGGGGATSSNLKIRTVDRPARSTRGGVTYAAFQRLRNGMSYEEAVQVLGGEGEEVSRTEIAGEEMVIYQWKSMGGFGGLMNATFNNGALINKTQTGLK